MLGYLAREQGISCTTNIHPWERMGELSIPVAGRGSAAKADATQPERTTYVISCALSWLFWASSLRLQLRKDQRVEYGFSETSHLSPCVHTSKPTRAIRMFRDR